MHLGASPLFAGNPAKRRFTARNALTKNTEILYLEEICPQPPTCEAQPHKLARVVGRAAGVSPTHPHRATTNVC